MNIENPETTLQRREKLAQNNARIAQDFLNTLTTLKGYYNIVAPITKSDSDKEATDTINKAIFSIVKHIQKKLEIV